MTLSNNTPPSRRVKMIAATYIKGVIADVGSEVNLTGALASEFVANGRAIYIESRHNDVESPPSAAAAVSAATPAPASAKPKTYA